MIDYKEKVLLKNYYLDITKISIVQKLKVLPMQIIVEIIIV